MATPTQIRRRGRWSLILGTIFAFAALAAVAYADDISNDLDASIDAVAETMPLNVGGANGTTQLYVTPRNGDGKNGCNLTGSTTLVLSVSSSSTPVATVSPSSVTFTSCEDQKTLTVTPVAQGSATISVSQTSNSTDGTFNLAPATFVVNVAPAANTAPNVSVAGVTGGASYDKGSVPAATCQVVDAEDGNLSFAATLSAIAGTHASDGIGNQTASCSYTDGGGLAAEASETYSIVDPSAPTIGYTLNPASPDGSNDWYTSNVSLTWDVSEPESPNSLQKIGCVDQNITVDQTETTYLCSASSAGGSADPISVVIKRDASAPTVTGVPAAAAVAGWYNAAVTINWTCSDIGPSGLASACPATAQISDEGRNLTDSLGPVSDNAGNSTTGVSSPAVNIDMTAPNAPNGQTSPAAAYVDGAINWYKDSVQVSFVSDGDPNLADLSAGSGVASVTAAQTFSTAGAFSKTGNATDAAGNVSAGTTVSGKIDASTPTFGACTGGPFILGSGTHNVSITAQDETSGSGLNAVTSSLTNTVDASSVGAKTVNYSASDNVGHSTTKLCSYSVIYNWTGFFAPVDNPNVFNVAKSGSAIPVKFKLGGDQGLGVLASATTQSVPCAATAPQDAIEELLTDSNSGLKYDAAAGQYIYVWKTGSWAGTCRQLNIKLDDGTVHSALFRFNK